MPRNSDIPSHSPLTDEQWFALKVRADEYLQHLETHYSQDNWQLLLTRNKKTLLHDSELVAEMVQRYGNARFFGRFQYWLKYRMKRGWPSLQRLTELYVYQQLKAINQKIVAAKQAPAGVSSSNNNPPFFSWLPHNKIAAPLQHVALILQTLITSQESTMLTDEELTWLKKLTFIQYDKKSISHELLKDSKFSKEEKKLLKEICKQLDELQQLFENSLQQQRHVLRNYSPAIEENSLETYRKETWCFTESEYSRIMELLMQKITASPLTPKTLYGKLTLATSGMFHAWQKDWEWQYWCVVDRQRLNLLLNEIEQQTKTLEQQPENEPTSLNAAKCAARLYQSLANFMQELSRNYLLNPNDQGDPLLKIVKYFKSQPARQKEVNKILSRSRIHEMFTGAEALKPDFIWEELIPKQQIQQIQQRLLILAKNYLKNIYNEAVTSIIDLNSITTEAMEAIVADYQEKANQLLAVQDQQSQSLKEESQTKIQEFINHYLGLLNQQKNQYAIQDANKALNQVLNEALTQLETKVTKAGLLLPSELNLIKENYTELLNRWREQLSNSINTGHLALRTFNEEEEQERAVLLTTALTLVSDWQTDRAEWIKQSDAQDERAQKTLYHKLSRKYHPDLLQWNTPSLKPLKSLLKVIFQQLNQLNASSLNQAESSGITSSMPRNQREDYYYQQLIKLSQKYTTQLQAEYDVLISKSLVELRMLIKPPISTFQHFENEAARLLEEVCQDPSVTQSFLSEFKYFHSSYCVTMAMRDASNSQSLAVRETSLVWQEQTQEELVRIRQQMERQEAASKQALEESERKAAEREKTLREEMERKADEKVQALRAEMERKADEKVQALRAEMEQKAPEKDDAIFERWEKLCAAKKAAKKAAAVAADAPSSSTPAANLQQLGMFSQPAEVPAPVPEIDPVAPIAGPSL